MRNHEFREMPTSIVASFSPATDQVIGAGKPVYEMYEESEFCHIDQRVKVVGEMYVKFLLNKQVRTVKRKNRNKKTHHQNSFFL